jgi:hypothetical protein
MPSADHPMDVGSNREMLRNVGMRSVEIRKQLVMLEKFIESDQYN